MSNRSVRVGNTSPPEEVHSDRRRLPYSRPSSRHLVSRLWWGLEDDALRAANSREHR